MTASRFETSIFEISQQVGLEIVDTMLLASRAARYAPVPNAVHPAVRHLLENSYPGGLYCHQAQALEAVLNGDDVCLATSTASGKSDVFISAAAHLLQQDGSAKVLALYPARALIQDQVEKWEKAFEFLKMRTGYIDGGVAIEERATILRSSHVVLMTPDVAHAWLMSHLREKEVNRFMGALRLLILDEAHVYDGVFGTNMAYFLRRFQAASAEHQLICSTATLGTPADFVEHLTGRKPRTFGPDEDGSPSPPKTILLARSKTEKHFETLVNLISTLGRRDIGLFLAFGDSRRMVEQLVAAVHRPVEAPGESSDSAGDQEEIPDIDSGPQVHESNGLLPSPRVLPYRAGYEAEDRWEIQRALSGRQLAGVVSTSALELGLDIGEIDLVVLLGLPPSVKAFWQRVGRAGRRNPGVCLLIDNRGALVGSADGLKTYLARELETSWLYLENRYIQYANALCAAYEVGEIGGPSLDLSRFTSLPTSFRRFLDNEINPTEVVPRDLYPLKQRAQGGPHREFPIRSGMEPDFDAKTPQGLRLGNLSFSQALREAYPGAIYYYMARPYRVYRFDYRKGAIFARQERHWVTKPLAQTMVFPRFQGGVLRLSRSETGFLAEAEMQVSERVLGFTERRGSAKPEEHRYGPSSPYYQREINRFFETTGVCWYFVNVR